MRPPPPRSTLFPYTTLFRSHLYRAARARSMELAAYETRIRVLTEQMPATLWSTEDRKSTRLNSSHVSISYAVFCLKKKNREQTRLKQIQVYVHRALAAHDHI